jgi:hypothetical protein
MFGWHYPPGAENDPNAPWNQPEGPEDEPDDFYGNDEESEAD